METVTGKDLLKTLKSLDIDTRNTAEDLEWVFDNKEASAFMQWFCTYLNKNNVEIANPKINKSSLENVDSGLCTDILKVNPDEVQRLRRQVKNAKAREWNCDHLTSKYLALERKTAENLRKLNEELDDLSVARQSNNDQCVKKSKKVDEYHNNLYESVQELSGVLYNSTNEKYFISDMPLEVYRQHCENFSTYLNLWIRRMLGMQDVTDSSFNVENLDHELHIIKYMLENSLICLVKSECCEKELAAKLSYVRNNTCLRLSEENERNQLICLTTKISILHENLEILYNSKMQNAAQQFSQYYINSILLKNAELKLKECRSTLAALKNLNSEIVQALALNEMLFLLMKTDSIKRQSINKFLVDMYFYAARNLKQYSVRLEIMNDIESNVGQISYKDEIIPLITGSYDSKPLLLTELRTEIIRQKTAIKNLEYSIFVKSSQTYMDLLKSREENVRKMREFIWCGPTAQPVIIPYNYLHYLNNVKLTLKKIENLCKSAKDNFTENTSKLERNRWLKYKRLLWMWFLIQPKQVITVINQLEDFVTKQAKNDSL